MYFQLIIIVLPFMLSFFIPLDNLFFAIIENKMNSDRVILFINELNINDYFISILIGLILSFILWWWITKYNVERLFNTGDKYFDYHYLQYWIGGKILRYGKINLVGIPIYMQFKLIINDVFPTIITDSAFANKEYSVNNKEIEFCIRYSDRKYDEINLILMDTYGIKESDWPEENKKFTTVIIKSGNQRTGIRTINNEFIELIRRETNHFYKMYSTLNIYATTNTNHNNLIVRNCIRNHKGRTGFKNVYVYKNNPGTHDFTERVQVI